MPWLRSTNEDSLYREWSKKNVKEIYKNLKWKRRKGDIIKSVIVEVETMKKKTLIPVKTSLCRNKHKKNDWLVLVSTDTEMKDEEIVRIYGKRWNIEVFFKVCKSFLKLTKEFQSRSYDALVAHTSIVFMRYMMLSLEERNNSDDRTICSLFYLLCDEIEDIKYQVSLKLILDSLMEELLKFITLTEDAFKAFFSAFINRLPNYIKKSLQINFCES